MRPIFLSMLLLLLGCEMQNEITDGSEISARIPAGTNLRVGPQQVTCTGWEAQQCLLIQEGSQIGTDDWELLYQSISGFEYEAGYIHNLEVVKDTVDVADQDASTIQYTLKRVISKVKL